MGMGMGMGMGMRICVCVCVWVWVSAYVYVYGSGYAHVWVWVSTYVYVHVYLSMERCACADTYAHAVHIHMRIHMRMHMRIHVRIHVRIHMHIHTHIHTHIHIRTAGLVLYGHEGCAETRLVREALSSLQLPFALVPCATAGGCRPRPGEREGSVGGKGRIPALVDGERMVYGGREAAEYVREKYAQGPPLSYFAPTSREEAL